MKDRASEATTHLQQTVASDTFFLKQCYHTSRPYTTSSTNRFSFCRPCWLSEPTKISLRYPKKITRMIIALAFAFVMHKHQFELEMSVNLNEFSARGALAGKYANVNFERGKGKKLMPVEPTPNDDTFMDINNEDSANPAPVASTCKDPTPEDIEIIGSAPPQGTSRSSPRNRCIEQYRASEEFWSRSAAREQPQPA